MMTDEPAGGASLELFGRLGVAIGQQTDVMRAVQQRLASDARSQVAPFTFEHSRNLVTPGANANPAVIGMGGPPQGSFWDIRNLVISGLYPTAVVAGRADVYVRSDNIQQAALSGFPTIGVSGWRDQAPSLPLVAFYGRGQVRIRANQKLYFVLSSYTVSTEYVAQAEIEQWQEGANPQIDAQ